MKVLIVKTTSLGDLVHMLPALSEALAHRPGLTADWVAEEGFADIPAMHPKVERVITVAVRRWRKAPWQRQNWRELREFIGELRRESYDLVLDSQGLIKSAIYALWAYGPRAGLNFASARESLASLVYGRRYYVPRDLHAITRNRMLTAQAMGYSMGAERDFSYGIVCPQTALRDLPEAYVVVLHGTSRPEKEYPEAYWVDLIRRLQAEGLAVLLPWGNNRERVRADQLSVSCPGARVLPRMGVGGVAGVLGRAVGVVGVDTGLMHMAAALRRPGVGLYPSTPPERFGVWAETGAPAIVNLSSTGDLLPERVVGKFMATLGS
jgi:heptosyltransferase-1